MNGENGEEEEEKEEEEEEETLYMNIIGKSFLSFSSLVCLRDRKSVV